ncbi:DUF6270 domain-containing protein [Bacillus salipaludis]|uniref:DUF6270 domain-containing protein n=1 Tax=Bacillus salipaludis TaxID=2547811 RepID=UPI002E1A6114|nr:DUF6270 domain-containing protein [Bacillus salipaludis]
MVTFQFITVDILEEKIRFKGSSSNKINSLIFSYQQIKEYKHPNVIIEVSVKWNSGKFEGDISLIELYKKTILDSLTTWNIFAKDEEELYKVDTDLELIKKMGKINVLPLLDLSFEKGSTTLLKFNLVPVRATIQTFQTINKQTTITGTLKSNNDKLVNHKIVLQAKRRPNSTLYNFHEEKFDFSTINLYENNNFVTEIRWEDLPEEFWVDNTNVCDFVFEISNEYGHRVTSFLELPDYITKEIVEKPLQLSRLMCLIKPYITGSKRLSFYSIKNNKNHVNLVSFTENNDYYQLELSTNKSFDRNEDKKLVLRRKDKKGNTFEYIVESDWNIDEKMQIQIAKDSFLSLPRKIHASTWDFFLRIGNADYYITVFDSIFLQSDYIYIQNQQYKAKIFRSPTKTLSCYTILSDKLLPNAINVAVMGTCFSRNMFNSSLYFNPGYKQILNCSFTQFHSSIISVMTNPFEFNLENYSDMSSSEKNFVKADFAKNFFENLKNSNSEYFLIDLYPDVIRPVIWLTDNSAVTLSYVVEESEMLNDLPLKRIIDHTDNVAFFNEWKMYVDLFIERLTEIIPPERIILNKGRFTTKYFDKDRKIVEFPNKMMIERNNYFWDKLDNYFHSKLPSAQILNIRQKSYIGDVSYPYGNSFSHYESSYYKDLFKELTHVILKERLNRFN